MTPKGDNSVQACSIILANVSRVLSSFEFLLTPYSAEIRSKS